MMFLNKKAMRKLSPHSIVSFVAIFSMTSIVQAAQFHLPPETPGFIGQTNAPFHAGNPQNYEKDSDSSLY